MTDPDPRDARSTHGPPLGTFFALTFALTWSAWWLAGSGALPAGVGGLGGPVFLLGVFAPALVALAFTAASGGGAGVRRLLARIVIWRVSVRWYVFAITYMAAIKLLAALVHRLWRGAWPAFGETPWPLLLAGTVASAWAQAGEEVGWRGYALPRLARQVGLGGASLLLGAIWALWHLPVYFLPGSPSAGQSFPVYFLHVVAMSVVFAWVYWRTGASLLLVILLHSAVNNTSGIVPAATAGAVGPFSLHGSVVAWATIAISWLVALVLLADMRRAGRDAIPGTGADRPPDKPPREG